MINPVTIAAMIAVKMACESYMAQKDDKKNGWKLNITPGTRISSVTQTAKPSCNAIKPDPKKDIPEVDERLVNIVTERLKAELPSLLKSLRENPSVVEVSQTLEVSYLNQISMAQEFLNENSNADLSRVKCLLRKMLPKKYHDVIETLKQHQDPKVIYNIYGGDNIIAPNAEHVESKQKPKGK